MTKKIMVVDDDPLFRRSIQNSLRKDYEILPMESAEQAWSALEGDAKPALILLDVTLPGMDGINMLKKVKTSYPEIPVIMLTALDRVEKAVQCIKLGAYDYLAKPVMFEELQLIVNRAVETFAMKRDLEQLRELERDRGREYRLLGASEGLEEIRKQIQTISQTDSTVLIEGETGTGKELVAREIHMQSTRSGGPFVPVNCGAIPAELIEAEFFGHKKGAFTGAHEAGLGKFQLANHGTILLDEIGELPMIAQTRLLRVIGEREFYPVGATTLVHVDVRVIASTNRNLKQLVQTGEFREDLYFRLNVCRIWVPPLRERPADISYLAEHFMRIYNNRFNKQVREITDGAKAKLLQHDWKGNVRELQNMMERLMLFHQGERITTEDLFLIDGRSPSEEKGNAIQIPPEGVNIEDVERDYVVRALEMTKGNRAAAARLLKLTPATLYYRLKKFNLD